MTAASPLQQAALGLLATLAYADGFSQAVFDWLEDKVCRHEMFKELPRADYISARSGVTTEWIRGPREAVWDKWVRNLPSRWAIPTFELAVEAVLLDGHVADIERKGLAVMARALNISPSEFDAAVQRVVARR